MRKLFFSFSCFIIFFFSTGYLSLVYQYAVIFSNWKIKLSWSTFPSSYCPISSLSFRVKLLSKMSNTLSLQLLTSHSLLNLLYWGLFSVAHQGQIALVNVQVISTVLNTMVDPWQIVVNILHSWSLTSPWKPFFIWFPGLYSFKVFPLCYWQLILHLLNLFPCASPIS